MADFISIHANSARIAGVMQAQMEATYWNSYNDPNAPVGNVQCGFPLTFVRARIQTLNSFDTGFNSTLAFDVSADGAGWTPVYELPNAPLLFRQVLFAQRSSGDVDFTTYFDFVRLDLDRRRLRPVAGNSSDPSKRAARNLFGERKPCRVDVRIYRTVCELLYRREVARARRCGQRRSPGHGFSASVCAITRTRKYSRSRPSRSRMRVVSE